MDRNSSKEKIGNLLNLRFLSESQIRLIDDALSSVGDFGEVHLIVKNGVLRFVVKQNSIDALKHSRDNNNE